MASEYSKKFLIGSVILAAVIIAGTPVPTHSEERPSAGVIINGLNVATLNGVVDSLKKNPEGGKITFYSTSVWQNGMRAFTSIGGYKIDGDVVHEGSRRFILLGDEGRELSGSDVAPGAVEELMYALGTCIIAATNANAALMGVKLTRLDVRVESDLDIHGLFALDQKVRPGIMNLRTEITIAGDADEATLEKIAMLGYKYSPVSETIRNGVIFMPEIYVVRGPTLMGGMPIEGESNRPVTAEKHEE